MESLTPKDSFIKVAARRLGNMATDVTTWLSADISTSTRPNAADLNWALSHADNEYAANLIKAAGER
ncbi:MAG TPA: hypothetical protein VFL85_03100 [Candidatus Saccharimonadales bacterium]|nr:hypothetical protein [Candidatus Saccharimonadales bacterium]